VLDRKDRMLPLSRGRAESHGFEYKRNGTLSLFAALNTPRRGSGDYRPAPHQRAVRRLLTDVVASQPEGREIQVICDNASSHKTDLVATFPAERERVTIHNTPTHSS
jgi:hypothetical protein